jgi:hypothetical protein
LIGAIQIQTQIQSFDDRKSDQIYSFKEIIFFIKNCNLHTPGPPLRTSKLQEKPSALKREHPAVQNLKFFPVFLFLRVIFALLDPDPADQNQCGSMPKQITFCLPVCIAGLLQE